MGIQFDEIMEKVQDNHSSAELTRLHLLKRMDLNNISSSFHLIQYKNDAESVRIWVEMCRQEKSEIVRFIKFPGENGPLKMDEWHLMILC